MDQELNNASKELSYEENLVKEPSRSSTALNE
jgi:hypothetical protein